MKEWLTGIYRYRDFLLMLLYLHMQLRYHGSVLGFLWTLLLPLLTFLSFTVVFTLLNRWDFQSYGLYFLSGYVFWNFFNVSLSMATDSIVGNAVFVTRVKLPKIVLPLAAIGISLIDLLAGTFCLLLFMMLGGSRFSLSLLALPLAILLSAFFAAGCGLLCSLANAYYRDFRHLLGSVLFLWFFYSPILWRRESVPESAALMVDINPVTPFLELYQAAAWRGEWPDLSTWLLASMLSFGVLALGLSIFRRHEENLYYYV